MTRHCISIALLFAILLVTPRASAQSLRDYELCAQGPAVELHPDEVEWAPESSCSCGSTRTSDPIRGGVMLSNDFVPWLWSQGTGAVVLFIEVGRDAWMPAFDSSGHTLMGKDGTGTSARLGNLVFTGRYRADCYIPKRRSPGPVRVVGDR